MFYISAASCTGASPSSSLIAFAQKAFGDVYHLCGRGNARYAAVAVKVGAYSGVFYSGNLNYVFQMVHCIEHRSFSVPAQKAFVESYLRHTACFSQCAELVVGKVSRVIAQRSRRSVAANNGKATYFHGIVETFFASVR